MSREDTSLVKGRRIKEKLEESSLDEDEIDRLQKQAIDKAVEKKQLTAFANNEDIIISSWASLNVNDFYCDLAFRLSCNSAKQLLRTLQLALDSAQNIDGSKLN